MGAKMSNASLVRRNSPNRASSPHDTDTDAETTPFSRRYGRIADNYRSIDQVRFISSNLDAIFFLKFELDLDDWTSPAVYCV